MRHALVGVAVVSLAVVAGCTNPVVPPADAGPMRIDTGPMPDSGGMDAFTTPDAFVGIDAFIGSDAVAPDDAFVAPDAACAVGSVFTGGVCAPIPAPRPVAPLSTSTVSRQQPMFHWQLVAPADGAHVEVCADRACGTIEVSFDATGASGMPGTALSAGVHYWRLTGRAGTVAGAVTGPVWEFLVLARSAARDASWGSTGDLNGDGYSDLVAAAWYPPAPGRAFVFYGGATGLPVSASVALDSPGGANSEFGRRMCSGDLNGDGFADLVVGAEGAFAGTPPQGRVYVYLGASAGIPTAPSITLSSPLGCFGDGVACAGDLNGDGYADLAAGHNGGAGCTGQVDLFLGGPTGPAATASSSLSGPMGSSGGFSADLSMGDVNGDGFADLFVGAAMDGSSGRIYEYNGAATIPTSPAVTLNASGSLPMFASFESFAFVGDLNGDGFGDVVAAPYSGAMPPAVYFGGGTGVPSSPSTTLSIPAGTTAAAWVIAPAGDVNRDGFVDLYVGNDLYPASGADRQGVAYVYFGATAGPPGLPSVSLSNPDGTNAYFGIAGGGGDVDGDGYADIAVDSYLGDLSGRVHLYRGGVGGTSTTSTWTANGPDGAGHLFGGVIAM